MGLPIKHVGIVNQKFGKRFYGNTLKKLLQIGGGVFKTRLRVITTVEQDPTKKT